MANKRKSKAKKSTSTEVVAATSVVENENVTEVTVEDEKNVPSSSKLDLSAKYSSADLGTVITTDPPIILDSNNRPIVSNPEGIKVKSNPDELDAQRKYFQNLITEAEEKANKAKNSYDSLKRKYDSTLKELKQAGNLHSALIAENKEVHKMLTNSKVELKRLEETITNYSKLNWFERIFKGI